MSASDDYKRKMTALSLDTIAVYNPTDKDVVFWSDKYGTSPDKTVVPASTRDIGFGKGIAHIPRYKARRYAEDMIVKIINGISDPAWEKRKKELKGLPKDEVLKLAASEQIRTNDKNLWYQHFPYEINRMLEETDTLESCIEVERQHRLAKDIDIPVKTLIWLGVVEKFGGNALPDPEEPVNILDRDPFAGE